MEILHRGKERNIVDAVMEDQSGEDKAGKIYGEIKSSMNGKMTTGRLE